MPKNTKKNAQPRDDSEGNISDDLQAETDHGVMKYMFSTSLAVARTKHDVTISARLLSKCSWSSLVLNTSARNILIPRCQLFFIAASGKKSSGSSRGFQTHKETRYNEARKKSKELVRDGIAFLYQKIRLYSNSPY